jgi:hypothetical protein
VFDSTEATVACIQRRPCSIPTAAKQLQLLLSLSLSFPPLYKLIRSAPCSSTLTRSNQGRKTKPSQAKRSAAPKRMARLAAPPVSFTPSLAASHFAPVSTRLESLRYGCLVGGRCSVELGLRCRALNMLD